MSKPEERAQRAKLHDKEDLIRKEMQAIEEVGIQRMSAADQEISRTPDREQLLKDKLEQHLNVSEWGQYQETAKRLESTREEIKKLPPPKSALALARCDPRPEADAHPASAEIRTFRATRSSRTFPRCSASGARDPTGGRRRSFGRAAASAGGMDCFAAEHAHGARDRQSRVAASLRPWIGSFCQQLWRAGNSAHASGIVGLSRAVVGRSQLAAQAAAPPDHDFQCLSHVVRRQREGAGC